MQRASGILLHPTALAGPFRVGDIGDESRRFVDFLRDAGQSVWQVLPLGPTGYGHSPYNALSAFAGNPVLIDLQSLVDCGDLDDSQLSSAIQQSPGLDFDQVHNLKSALLVSAGQRFCKEAPENRKEAFNNFCDAQKFWLDDFCLFMALRESFPVQSWVDWPEELRTREAEAIRQWQETLHDKCLQHKYQQFIFAEQWLKLKTYANLNHVQIFGDIPIFVAYDSADVWANQGLFQLDERGRPLAVAGVPPDYFSATGQRWGNPLYRWDRLAETDFLWWQRRFEHDLQISDMVRIDHFRGFQACWSIPAEEKTAIKGQWEEVPGRAFFEKLLDKKMALPIIAEDLGVITPEVEQLRDDFGFPGMKILQFAFDSGPDNPYLPENHSRNSVVYTGTHDNNTTLGWWHSLTKEQKDQVRNHLGTTRPEIPWGLIEMAMASIANLCIIPCQDILGLDKEARFNTPGQATGNWSWQMCQGDLTEGLAQRLYKMTKQYRRLGHR